MLAGEEGKKEERRPPNRRYPRTAKTRDTTKATEKATAAIEPK
jgi:hypothetical protein